MLSQNTAFEYDWCLIYMAVLQNNLILCDLIKNDFISKRNEKTDFLKIRRADVCMSGEVSKKVSLATCLTIASVWVASHAKGGIALDNQLVQYFVKYDRVCFGYTTCMHLHS